MPECSASPTQSGPSRVALISALSNLSISYNISAIAIALGFMDNSANNKHAHPAYPRTDAQSSLLNSLVFAGAISGQLTMGFAGDVLGRRRAMLLTNSFSLLGCLGTALFTWGSPDEIYATMSVFRFLLGVGVGGKYPLSATMSQEDTRGSSKQNPAELAKGFFWQTPGAMLPYAFGLIFLASFGKDHFGAEFPATTSLQFRLILGLGALPTLATTVLTYFSTESDEFTSAGSSNPFRVARAHPELFLRLAGCGLSWCLYDFVYFGTAFNQVVITSAIFGETDKLFDVCWQNVILTAMGLPGVVTAIALLYRWSSRTLQAWGFVAIAAACVALSIAVFVEASDGWKFCIFCSMLFAINWGVNVSTYCMPAEIFPTALRSTFFGLAAGMGKVGALLGSAMFGPIEKSYGLDGVYLICAGVCLLGLVLTLLLLPSEQLLKRETQAIIRLLPTARVGPQQAGA